MMKKMLVLTLVLCLAGFASAAVVEATYDEAILMTADLETGIVEITLLGGDTSAGFKLQLDIQNDADGSAAFDWAAISFPTTFDFAGKSQLTTDISGQITASQFFTPAVTGETVLMTGLASAGDVYEIAISVAGATDLNGASLASGTVLGVLPIPEPMTMALLGLGGLFIRRKK
jgi:hypothetical protein